MDACEQTSTVARAVKAPGKKQSTAAAHDRRKLGFWQPFNDWWRGEFDKTGKRPTADDIIRWYGDQSDKAWGHDRPSLQETRVHAKCLRSVTSVRDYFREYRAKKKGEEEEGDAVSDDIPTSTKHGQLAHAFSSNSVSSSDMATTSGVAGDGSCDAAPAPKRKGRPPKRQGPGSLDGAIHRFLVNKPGGPPPDLQPLPTGRRTVRKLRVGRAAEVDAGASLLPGSGPRNQYRPGMEALLPGDPAMAASAAAALAAQSRLAGLHLDPNLLLPACGGVDAASLAAGGAASAGLGLLSPMRLLLSPKGLMSAHGMLPTSNGMAAAGGFPAAAFQGTGFSIPAGMPRVSEMVPVWDNLLSFANVPSVAQTMELLVVEEAPPAVSASAGGNAAAGQAAAGSGSGGMFALSAAATAVLVARQRPRMLELPEQFMDVETATGKSPRSSFSQLWSTSRQPGPPSSLPHMGHAAIPNGAATSLSLHGGAVLAPIEGELTGAPPAASVGMVRPSLGAAAPANGQQHDGQAGPSQVAAHPATQASTAQDNIAAVLSLQRMCPGMPIMAPQLLGQQWHTDHKYSHKPSGRAPHQPGMPKPTDGVCRQPHQVPVGGFVGLHGLGMLQPVAFDAITAAILPEACAAGADGGSKHKQVSAGILMELESVKGPAMASLVHEHTAAQMQRISVGLLESAVWEPPLLRRMPALQGADLLMGPPGQPGRLSLRTIPSCDVAGLDAEERWLDQFIRSNGGFDDGHDVIQAVLSPNGLKTTGMSLGIRGEHAVPSTTGTGASDGAACERKRGRSLQRLSNSLLPDWDLAKRFKVSGVSNLMMELDTPKVRALHQVPAPPFNATCSCNSNHARQQDACNAAADASIAAGSMAATAGPSGQQQSGDIAGHQNATVAAAATTAEATAVGTSGEQALAMPEAPKWPNTHLAQLLFGTSGPSNSTGDEDRPASNGQQGAPPKAILPSMHEIQRMLR